MLLSAQEISLARERMLSNMLALSVACIDSAHQLLVATTAVGRSGLQQGGAHCSQLLGLSPDMAAQRSTAFVLDQAARAGALFEEALLVASETQKVVIRCSETQVRILDAMAVAAIERLRKTSPWEAEPALNALTESLATTERALHRLSGAAIETVAHLEGEMRGKPGAAPGGRLSS